MWQELISVLFPNRCIECETIVTTTQKYLCENCKANLPFTGIKFNNKNLIHQRINLLTSIENASSLLYFENKNITQKLIHHLKYKNQPEIGEWLAEIWIDYNRDNPLLSEIETIVPVPIHSKRLKKRNYNQIELCCEKLAKELNCKLDRNILIRTQHLESQTQSNREMRLKRMKNTFKRTHNKNGHFLLVDDVFTTGSTFSVCADELLKAGNSKVSIFSLALVN